MSEEIDLTEFEKLDVAKTGERRSRFDYDAIKKDLLKLGEQGLAVTMRKIEEIMRRHQAYDGMIHWSQKSAVVQRLIYDGDVEVYMKDGIGRGRVYLFRKVKKRKKQEQKEQQSS